MQVGNISLVSQRFAPTRCNCSSSSQVKKTRNRIPKEERRAMVETFITKFRETNEGTFPSLKKTHKEVGGSFYTVREIVRDIIQENRVLGPGDLDMQTLTLENVPISPEICENGTGLEQDFEGNGNGGFQYIDDEFSIEIETETIEEFEFEIKGEKAEISMENGKICTGDLLEESLMDSKIEKIDKVYEIKELLTEIVQNNGKVPTGDLQEISVIEIKKERMKSEIKEVESEISQNNGKILTGDLQENSVMEIKTEGIEKAEIEEVKSEIYVNGKITTGDLHESEMKMKVEPTENSESEIKELENDQLSTGDLHFESKMEVVIKTETVDKSEFDIKEESEILQINETEKLGLEVGLGLGDFKSNDGFDRAKRTVVQVEQFPLPSKSHNKNDSGSVLAEGKNKEQELNELQQTAGSVNSKTETLNKIENSVSSNSSVQEKSVATISKTENEAVSENATKTKKETSEKKREKAQANPFWVTFHAFITSVVKFWSQ